jgi:ribosomal protein S18 acetylase RimI-like enzyme
VIAIREMADADMPALIALWHEAGVARPWNPPERDIAFARRGDHSTILVATVGEALAGSAMAGEDGHRGWVYYVAVAPAQQGSGVGRALMMAAEAWLLARGVWKMQLLVRTENVGVQEFYEKLGYRRVETVTMQKAIG